MLDTLEARLAKRPGRALNGEEAPNKRASVAAVLRSDALSGRGAGELLFIRRSEREGDPWSGHMAFPGGRRERGDLDDRHTAERETHEELGLDLGRNGRLVGTLDQLVTPVRRGPVALVISPFVYRLTAPVSLVPNHEVAGVHWFSLERLASGEGRSSFSMRWREQTWQMPCIDLEGVRIWGLTLRMLDDMLDLLGGRTSPPVRALSER